LNSLKFYQKFSSNPNSMTEIEEFVIKATENLHLDDTQMNQLTSSVAEASSNCIVHGNKSDESKIIEVEIVIDDKNIMVKLKDEGSGFEVDKVPDPTLPENILKDSGRGIHIMKSFLTELKYNFTETGTETILIFKYL
jgi:serine/threonine-protein kinase RsbW